MLGLLDATVTPTLAGRPSVEEPAVPPSRRTSAAPPALTDDDVAQLRGRVDAGETPRVVVRAASASVAAGTRGSVIRLGDPAENEYIVVRLGRDEVPFAPAELGIPGRKPAPVPVAAPAPARKPAAARKPPARRATRPPKAPAKRVPPLVVTLRFRDGSWTVEAQRGARRLAKPSALRPGAVSAFAEHVDDDGVRDALVETVESCRAVVEARAMALRAELHAAESVLRDYDKKPGRH
jgi:Family of unknown function (DUF6319)